MKIQWIPKVLKVPQGVVLVALFASIVTLFYGLSIVGMDMQPLRGPPSNVSISIKGLPQQVSINLRGPFEHQEPDTKHSTENKKLIGPGVVTRPNILFLIADDLRPELGSFAGKSAPWINPNIKTPHLDRLAEKSLVFRRAYCQQAWCNPSRASFLTSRRPDTTMVHNNSVNFRTNHPTVVTIPQFFKNNGYMTLGMGKVFHLLGQPGDHDDEHSWSERMLRIGWEDFINESDEVAWTSVSESDRKGRVLLDEFVTDAAIDTLRKVAPAGRSGLQPFFLAVGMKKPHLPFVFPESFLDYYPLEDTPDPVNPYVPRNMPRVAWATSNEIAGKKLYKQYNLAKEPNKTLPADQLRPLRRAYYSSVTYIDILIGAILKEVDDLGLTNNTIVSFIGDHGYHLGEHGIFGKNTNFEVANNSPMMIRVPGLTDQGQVTDKLVELVDIFPTLVELAGFDSLPHCPFKKGREFVNLCTEGSSLVPLFRDQQAPSWKDRVFYQYPRFISPSEESMGYSMRTDRYRYTEWVRYEYIPGDGIAYWDTVNGGVELYDHLNDPHEQNNIAQDEHMEDLMKDLSEKLRDGWQGALRS